MFDFLKKLFSNKSLPDKDPDLEPAEILADLQPQIDALGDTCIDIKILPGSNLKPENSRFGGLPYFPESTPYPHDSRGVPMRLLAQINFAELPSLEPYPSEGLLQFYVSGSDELYGIDFNNPSNQADWRVMYFENTDFEPLEESEAMFAESWEYSPMTGAPFALECSLRMDYPSSPAMEYERDILPLFKEVEKGDYEDFLEDLYLDKELGLGHKIGGFPHFTQNDIRESKPEFADYRLLFQMDSDLDKIMWGDVGVANFFIHPEDLEKRDFSKVIYNWDCH